MTIDSTEQSRDHTVPTTLASEPFRFPGRWVGGGSLILGPLLIATGALLRIQFHFFAPQQLAAYQEHPTLITAAYSVYSIGSVVLCFGIISLANLIGRWSPVWAGWAGCLAICGLFNRTFSAGVDHLAFQLVRVQNLDMAFQAVSDSYRAFHIFRTLNGAIMMGWVLLAIGAYRSGTLGRLRSVALGLMVMLPFGTLKGTEIRSIAIIGLCVALIPLGVSMLRNGPPLSRRAKFWIVVVILFDVIMVILARIFPVLTN
jgi:hypothetical protein